MPGSPAGWPGLPSGRLLPRRGADRGGGARRMSERTGPGQVEPGGDRGGVRARVAAAGTRLLRLAGAPAATTRATVDAPRARHWPLWAAAGVAAGLLADGATLGL